MSRCRQYRKVKKEKDGEQLTELDQLEQENTRLRVVEQQMREKLEKAKKKYIELITSGRIRFV